jgi:pyruvate dehydrogenase E2 component (dihydrolipoyllysine-residue acetyltransferase)
MPKAVIMPKFGFTQEESTLVTWLVKVGDRVEQGDPLCEVTTDKINMEVEAPVTGILDGVRYREGETVPVTQVIAFIRSVDEAPLTTETMVPQSSASTPAREDITESRATPVATNLAKEKGVDLGQVPGTGPGGRVTRRNVEVFLAGQVEADVTPGKVRAVPAARRLARETGVELSQIPGTGPSGRVQTADVRATLERPVEPANRQVVTMQEVADVGKADLQAARTVPLTGMRLTIATRMQKSSQEAPHITFDADVDATNAEALRVRANELLEQGQPRISLTAIIAKACAWALKRNPFINSRLDDNQILLLNEINIGIAVALEEGLIVPVVRAVDQKGFAQVAAEIAELAERARIGRLRPDDVTGGTFTISNLGMFGVDRFTAIINPPESAILAVGRTTRRIVPDEEDRPVVRPIMTVTLSADHRVVDGALAALFIRDVRMALEHPDLISL